VARIWGRRWDLPVPAEPVRKREGVVEMVRRRIRWVWVRVVWGGPVGGGPVRGGGDDWWLGFFKTRVAVGEGVLGVLGVLLDFNGLESAWLLLGKYLAVNGLRMQRTNCLRSSRSVILSRRSWWVVAFGGWRSTVSFPAAWYV